MNLLRWKGRSLKQEVREASTAALLSGDTLCFYPILKSYSPRHSVHTIRMSQERNTGLTPGEPHGSLEMFLFLFFVFVF